MLFESAYNFVNEVVELTKTKEGGSPVQLPFAYDDAGNLSEKTLAGGSSLIFIHDAWNRLVRIDRELDTIGGQLPLAEYRYNGLHQRIYKRVDTETDPQATGFGVLDQQHLFYYSVGWQILEELIEYGWDGQNPPADSARIEYVWGARYIDDIVMRILWHTGDAIPEPEFAIYYHLTDHQFSTVALIDSAANLLERVTYDAYGMARHHWKGDLTGDGAVGDDDLEAMRTSMDLSIGDAEYNVDADITRTGTVTETDLQWTEYSNYKAALPKGDLSAYWNVIGYCGYVFNPEVPTSGGGGGLYTVRFRHYDAELGRWLERDPLGYVDGMNLYGYGLGSPISALDPFGLCAGEDDSLPYESSPDHSRVEPSDPGPGGGSGGSDPGSGNGGGRSGATGANPWHGQFFPEDDDGGLTTASSGMSWGAIALEIGLLFVPGGAVIKVARWAWRGYMGYRAWRFARGARVICRTVGRCICCGNVCACWFGGGGGGGWWSGAGRGAGAAGRGAGAAGRAGCFLAGTLVATASGMAPIEDVQAGDEVWSYDHDAQEWELREVERVFEHVYFGDIVALTILHEDGSRETIEATGGHPFWVVQGVALADRPGVEELPVHESQMTSTGRWTEARHLRLGDHFLTRTGKSATVAGLIIRTERVKVYNLQVADLRFYAVGEHGVLVHNKAAFAPRPKPIAGRGNLIKRLYKDGWTRRPPTKAHPNTWFFSHPAGAQLRIMPGIRGNAPARTRPDNLGKYNTPWYYRYRNSQNDKWGPAIPLRH